MYVCIHFFRLCPLGLTIKLNFNISKVAYCLWTKTHSDKCKVKVQSVDSRETYYVLYQSLKARLSCFPVKLVIITNKFAIVIKVTIFSCDGLVVITTEFAIIIEVARLS